MSNLTINPASPLDFGIVSVGSSADIDLILSVDDTDSVSVTSISLALGTVFTIVTDPTPVVINGSSDSALVKLRYTPVAAVANTDALDILHGGTNNPSSVGLQGSGSAAGTKTISVNPSGWNFPDTRLLTSSSQKVFTITNTGTLTVSITALNFSGDFAAGATAPALPYNLTSGSTVDFGAKFSPTSEGYLTGSVSVVSDAVFSPAVIDLTGTGFLLTPAYIVTSRTYTHLFGLANNDQTVVLDKLADPLSYDTEDGSLLQKAIMLPFPTEQGAIPGFSYEKQVMRVFMHYEDWGEVTLTVLLTTLRGQTSQQTQTIGTIGGTGALKVAVFDIMVVDEVVHLQITRTTGGGPAVIVDYTVKYETKGERAK